MPATDQSFARTHPVSDPPEILAPLPPTVASPADRKRLGESTSFARLRPMEPVVRDPIDVE